MMGAYPFGVGKPNHHRLIHGRDKTDYLSRFLCSIVSIITDKNNKQMKKITEILGVIFAMLSICGLIISTFAFLHPSVCANAQVLFTIGIAIFCFSFLIISTILS